MTNSTKLLGSTWELIANDGVDYVLQVTGDGTVLVKASATVPTGTEGAFILGAKELITSQILSGNVYARSGYSKSGNVVQIVYAK